MKTETVGEMPGAIDVDRARADTRGAEQVVHLNNAGSALPPRQVTDTVVEYLRHEELVGGYEAAEEAAGRIDGVYASLARLINAVPAEVAVMESGSTAWERAVSILPLEGSRVLVSRTEYHNNLPLIRQLADRGNLRVDTLDDDAHGGVSVDHLSQELSRGDIALVAIPHAAMGNGLVNPVEEVGQACRAAGVLFLLDVCQSIGQLPVDVNSIGCDIAIGTGRKFLRAPRGTAFAYVRSSLIERCGQNLFDRDLTAKEPTARLLESWETSIAGRLGLGRAADYALDFGLDAIRERLGHLSGMLRTQLSEVPGVSVLDRGLVQSAIVTFSVADTPSDEVKLRVRAQGINVSAVPAPHGDPKRALDYGGRDRVVRASPHYYNTEAELERLIEALRA